MGGKKQKIRKRAGAVTAHKVFTTQPKKERGWVDLEDVKKAYLTFLTLVLKKNLD